MKRIISLLLAMVMLVGVLASCGTEETPAPTPEKLATPTEVSMSDTGLITWTAVTNATSYVVTIADKTYTVNTNSYQVTNLNVDFTYTVKACAKGYTDSDASSPKTFVADRTPEVVPPTIAVAVGGASELRSGHETVLTATVSGTADQTVLWSVVSGGDYVTINEFTGALKAKSNLTQDVVIEVRATSLADESCYGSRIITLVSKPVLTQAMLDAAAKETTVEFGGYINISLYNFGLTNDLYMTSTSNIRTATDGVNWFAEYVNGNTGLTEYLYFKNDNGIASQIGVNLKNEEEYFPMLDDFGNEVTWYNSGFYNSFDELNLADFRFDEETWRYVYVGADVTLPQRIVACANPYDFEVDKLALILEEGEIIGIYAIAKDDFSIVAGYRGVQEMVVTMNYGDTVEVPTIGKFETVDFHSHLATAIENMKNLNYYKTDYLGATQTMGLTPDYSGYVETITPTDCYYEGYTWDLYTEQTTFTGEVYGNHQIDETLYNTYFADGKGGYYATRAYAGNMSAVKPTFDFAPEIFTSYYYDEEKDEHTYYVNSAMSSVATTFYHGIGNDIALYGIFATDYIYVTGQSYYTPYVVVKDGYIIEAGFYFDIIQISGHIMLTYSNFNDETLQDGVNVEFTPRALPTAWSELTIQVLGGYDGAGEDVEVNAHDYFADVMFESEEIAQKVPFFGDVLGDSYGVGMTTFRMPGGSNVGKMSVALYYDVPLDRDSTINSSLEKLDVFLTGLGYTRNRYGEYVKDEIVVVPTDVSLDLFIYVWRA